MPKLGVFIDATTFPAELAKVTFAELEEHGDLTLTRAYADWGLPSSAGWAGELVRHAIMPMSATESTSGRHALDTALVVHALDMHHGDMVDGFVILSDSGDFADLARRLGADGTTVIGVGVEKASPAFKAACSTYLDANEVSAAASARRVALAAATLARRPA